MDVARQRQQRRQRVRHGHGDEQGVCGVAQFLADEDDADKAVGNEGDEGERRQRPANPRCFPSTPGSGEVLSGGRAQPLMATTAGVL